MFHTPTCKDILRPVASIACKKARARLLLPSAGFAACAKPSYAVCQGLRNVPGGVFCHNWLINRFKHKFLLLLLSLVLFFCYCHYVASQQSPCEQIEKQVGRRNVFNSLGLGLWFTF
eukprot:TRINITY_DN26860_c0_g2_i1.p1 TRINITY_DN26860_c0_g2~~TRINITY_DN26860_c0_g2_i1.p1  ORF type:complete len:117 (+),score=4.92 TRINITY_DN26860_c0_g2_i1:164-514(+)